LLEKWKKDREEHEKKWREKEEKSQQPEGKPEE
jgi:hypothetical protein